MVLLGIVTATGSARPGMDRGLRLCTLNLYFDGSFQATIDVAVSQPNIGDRYSVTLKKET